MFGHLASSQTVWSFCVSIRFFKREYVSPPGIFAFSHSGLLGVGCSIDVCDIS